MITKTDRSNTGFTLVELILTLAIASIVMVAAAPSIQVLVQNNRLTAQTNELVASLNLARSEAVKRAKTVTVCKSATLTNCDTTGSGDWEVGWIVFVDDNGDVDVDTGDTIVRVVDGLAAGNSLRSASTNNSLQYTGDGRVNGAQSFALCDSRGATHARAIVLTTVGRTRLGVDGDDNGTVEDLSGADVTCP
ncbi:MAG: GspH/FimT family pseudopilin [Pseudomonadota bacterium]|nr:GspH/FimT family pseudopilin [Pseudomonadota bacterium]